MELRLHKKLYFIVAVISGASLTLSFAPFRFWPISFLSLLSLIWLFKQQTTAKSCFYLGFCWGASFFTTSVSWIFISIHRYGNTDVYIASLITTLFIILLALFPAINLYLLKKFKLDDPTKWHFIVAFPASWVLLEIFRSWVFTGFPWVLLGYTQLSSPLKYYASFFGVYGVSFIVALIASVLVGFFYNLNNKKKLLILVLILLICFGFAYLINNKQNHIISKQHTVAMIQGNIEPNDKFLLQEPTAILKYITDIYWLPTIDLVAGEQKIDLVIWPENSLPIEARYPEVESFLNNLNQLSLKNNFGLLLGIPIANNYKNNYFYNSVLALGTAKGTYYKRNLVPFGDYVPLENLFRGLINFFDLPMSSFMAGTDDQKAIKFNDNNIVTTVCYDIAYADYVRSRVLNSNASVIIAVSEDGWFGDSLGPHQHLDIARMRAIETGRYVLRATTSGISAIIDNNGNVIKQAPRFKKFNLVGQYQDCFEHTLWNKLGNNLIICFLAICLILTIIDRSWKKF